jgi:hypothetical protein
MALSMAGFRQGLTYQSMPYDFRKSYRTNTINKIFKKNLKRMKELTGKKVIILTHSFGGVNAQYQLSKMSQEDKDKYIAFWIAQAPPFLGALKVTRILLSGLKEFYFQIFGFRFKASTKVTSSHPVYYELLYKNPYVIYKDHAWFDWVKQRYLVYLLI